MAKRAIQVFEKGRDNRALARKTMSVSARLELPSGGRSVQIVDLSDGGARLEVSAPPPVGAPALLKWHSHECYSTVAWVAAGECGLRFDKHLAQTVLGSCAEPNAARIKSVAALDRIRIGAKRRDKALTLGAGADQDHGFAWTIALRRPPGSAAMSREALSPAEEMFFYHAPLAHVVGYHEHQRLLRRKLA